MARGRDRGRGRGEEGDFERAEGVVILEKRELGKPYRRSHNWPLGIQRLLSSHGKRGFLEGVSVRQSGIKVGRFLYTDPGYVWIREWSKE